MIEINKRVANEIYNHTVRGEVKEQVICDITDHWVGGWGREYVLLVSETTFMLWRPFMHNNVESFWSKDRSLA